MKPVEAVRRAGNKALELKTRMLDLRARHQERHRPSGFSFALFDAIAMVRPDHWDALTAGRSICFSRPFLEVLEAHPPASLRPHYALVYRGGRPVAAVVAQSVEVSAASLPKAGEEGAEGVARLARASLAKVKQRVLVCGNLLCWGPLGAAFAPGEDPKELWPAVAEALYRIRRADKLFGDTGLVMVKDLTDAEGEAGPALRRFSYRPLETQPCMVLDLEPRWKSFEDYLKDMKSDYRSGIRKQLRDTDEAGLRVRELDAREVAARAQEIHRLYLQVHDRQAMRISTLDPDWIPAMAGRFGQDFRTTVIEPREGGPLLGFCTCLKDGPDAIAYHIGYDKAASARWPLYLRLLYALVERGIDLGAASLTLGRTALAPKAKLGARAQPMRCFLRHRIPALNAVVAGLLQAAPDPEQPPERSPFKPGARKGAE